ncbi:MAG: hypothetical protein LKF61_02080 [Eggerthellaceae bacterium]|nr:hypothetical protein [Eggerthellaceae bacterium]MCH4220898.1 hypothetical protein [Eggerthellaceae bacterium]
MHNGNAAEQHCTDKKQAAAGKHASAPVPTTTPAPVSKHIHASADKSASTSKPAPRQPIRAINEDDDGYDPYTDLHDRPEPEPFFEPHPWD